MSALPPKIFYLESDASNGSAASSCRVIVEIPQGYRRVRFLVYNETTRSIVNAEIGLFDGTNLWTIRGSVGSAVQDSTEFTVPHVAPGAVVPNGIRTLYVQPSAAPTAGQRLAVTIAFSAD